MTKITETIELSKEEYKKMEELRKELNLSIHDFINIAVKDAIQTECERSLY